MSEQPIKSRLVHKHDIADNWALAQNFVPKQGELIVYDDRYKDKDGNEIIVADTVRYKIGDGTNTVTALPFLSISSDADLKLSEQFTITQDFGYYKLDGAASKKVGTVGQSIHQFLQGAFAEEDKTIFSTSPSCSISMSGGSYEVGSTVTPLASWSTSAGTYKWGTYSSGAANYSDKATGITYKDSAGGTLDASDISIDKTSFIIGTSSVTVTASGTAKRSAVSKYPCSNLGSDLTSNLAAEYKSEKTLTPSKTATFTCYRRGFYGALTSKDSTINSALVRGLSSKTTSTPAAGNKWTLSIPVGTTRVVFAYPATIRDINKVEDAATKYDVKTSFTKHTITVEGASPDTSSKTYSASYKVYVSDFANATTEANTYTITI